MENNELHEIWRNADSVIIRKSKTELRLLLASKSRKVIAEFLYMTALSLIICAGLIIYLVITSLRRQDDAIYLIINGSLGALTLILVSSGLVWWYKMQQGRYALPLRGWLEGRIDLISKYLEGRFSKLYLYLIPLLTLLLILSIHVYFEEKLVIEVLSTEESVIGLVAGLAISLFTGYYLAVKIRKYQLKQLTSLKDLHARLESAG